VHPLPDPARCGSEVFRVLKPGGSFVAFDPNRLNPLMYLYRYLASSKLRWLLPAYNAIDRILFAPGFTRPLRAFVLA
jgi:SAM-dependent methyltransferase